MNDSCLWTAWGEVVCRSKAPARGTREHFFGGTTTATTCTLDTDCDALSRCDNTSWQCRPCSDVGCVAGKTCASSSDCAAGLSCQPNAGGTASVCTVGGVVTRLNNSANTVQVADYDTVGQSYEAQRQAYMTNTATLDSGIRDCAMFGTCPQGYPCDGSAQCLSGLMCDAGTCKTTYSGLL